MLRIVNKIFVFASFFLITQVQCHEVEYALGVMERTPAFSGSEGWGREILRTHLGIPRDVVVTLFRPMTLMPRLSITAKIDGAPIAERNCNFMYDWLEKLQQGIVVVQEKYPEENVRKFLAVYQKTLECELQLLQKFFDSGVSADQIAHNAGLLVLQPYEGQGIGTALQQKSLVMLKEQGIRVVVAETTNKRSAKIMHKLGFVAHAVFAYHDDFGVNGLDGNYTIWYKEL